MVTLQEKDIHGNVDIFFLTLKQHFKYLWRKNCYAHRADTCYHWRGANFEGVGLQKRLFNISLDVLTAHKGIYIDLSAFEKLL